MSKQPQRRICQMREGPGGSVICTSPECAAIQKYPPKARRTLEESWVLISSNDMRGGLSAEQMIELMKPECERI